MARDIQIKIGASNAASAVMGKVASDAGRLGSKVAQSSKLSVASLNRISDAARRTGASIRAIGLRIGAAGAAIAGGIGLGFAGIIKVASDLEETMGKFDVVFGSNAGVMKEWSDATASAMGVSRESMARMASGLQDLFVPMGVAPGKATDMSKTLSKLAIDLGSFNNIDSDRVMTDLMAAMTGSGETMKKYGVVMQEAHVKQELFNMGLDPKTADDAAKAQARLNIIMRGTTAAQGDAIRTQDSFANAMKRMKAVISDVSAILGKVLLNDLAVLLTKFTDGLKVIRSFMEANEGLARGLVYGAGIVGVFGVALVGLGVTLGTVGFAITGLSAIVGAITFAFSPLGIAIVGVTAAAATLAGGIIYLARKFDLIGPAVEGAKRVFGELLAVAKKTFEGINNALQSGDMQLAAKIGMAGVKVAIFNGLAEIGLAFTKMIVLVSVKLVNFFNAWVRMAQKAAFAVANMLMHPTKAFETMTDFLNQRWIDMFTGGKAGGDKGGIAAWFADQRRAAIEQLDKLIAEAKTKQEKAALEAKKTALETASEAQPDIEAKISASVKSVKVASPAIESRLLTRGLGGNPLLEEAKKQTSVLENIKVNTEDIGNIGSGGPQPGLPSLAAEGSNATPKKDSDSAIKTLDKARHKFVTEMENLANSIAADSGNKLAEREKQDPITRKFQIIDEIAKRESQGITEKFRKQDELARIEGQAITEKYRKQDEFARIESQAIHEKFRKQDEQKQLDRFDKSESKNNVAPNDFADIKTTLKQIAENTKPRPSDPKQDNMKLEVVG